MREYIEIICHLLINIVHKNSRFSHSCLKKKISFLTPSLGHGGAEKITSILVDLLSKEFEVYLFTFYNLVHFPVPKNVNLIVFRDERPRSKSALLKLIDTIFFVPKYFRAIKKYKIDCAVSFLAFPNLINGLLALRHKGITTIISERGFPSDNTTSKTSYFIAKIFYPLLYNRCAKLFSNSIFINRDLKENFGVKIPMEVIYNPIEKSEFVKAPEQFAKKLSPLKIITVGTLNKRKNQIMILKAIAELKEDIQLVILGTGELKDQLMTAAIEFGIEDRVNLAGRVKNVNEYLYANDVFVLSSLTEGFPNALLEALNVGLPCISTNCLSGPLELLNEGIEIDIPENEFYLAKYGILINNNDDIALAKALTFLKDNPDKRVYYSKMSLKRVEKYSLDIIYDQFKTFIEV